MAVISLQFQQRIPFVDREGRLSNEGIRALNSLASQIEQIAQLNADFSAFAGAPVITSTATPAFNNERVLAVSTPLQLFYAPGSVSVVFSGYTDDVPEGVVNLYFTNARARLAINGSTTVSYNNSTGVISLSAANVAAALGYTPYNAANPAGYVDQSGARSSLSGGTGITYNSGTGVIALNTTYTDARYVQSGGALPLGIRTITATATPAATDYTLLCDATSGPIVVNLPAASSQNGRMLNVKKIDASANTVTIDPNGAELIDGAATQAISVQWDSYLIQCNGAAWFRL